MPRREDTDVLGPRDISDLGQADSIQLATNDRIRRATSMKSSPRCFRFSMLCRPMSETMQVVAVTHSGLRPSSKSWSAGNVLSLPPLTGTMQS